MPKHRAGPTAEKWVLPAVGVVAVTGLAVAGALAVFTDESSGPSNRVAAASCDRPVRVVTAASFAPVLSAMASETAGDDCLRVQVITADGRAAVAKALQDKPDVWIPDDAAWAGSAGSLGLVQAPAAGAGTVLATSPLYMVADGPTMSRLRRAGSSWLGLAHLVDDKSVRLVVRDPAGSGDGMVAAGAVAEAVWLDEDMDASALWLAGAKRSTRTVTGNRSAIPTHTGEVGVMPEYSLRPALTSPAGSGLSAVPGTDHTAMLRYTWFPLAAAVADPARAVALDRLREKLTDPAGSGWIAAANLRTPDAAQQPSADGTLAAPKAKPFDVLGPHHVDHVFATWYIGDRRTNLLVVVDVSGSMAVKAGGSKASRIELVRQGSRAVSALLPDESRMGLWEFGSKLDGDRDYKSLLGMGPLDRTHRQALSGAIGQLDAQETGTGLYDTILAAYTSARDAYRPGVPNQVLIFTDGRNEADENSLTPTQLAAALKKTADPKRPVLLSVVTFGSAGEARVLNKAVAPVTGYVDVLTTADEVAAVFIHVAAGGLHH
jgi:hypothetical protein